MFWLGERRGYLADWVTQRWVQLTGRRVDVKVVFPLPNGNAQVLMRPTANADGSLTVTSAGERFGDPGFYFSVHHRPGPSPIVWARHVRALRESIHVYAAPDGVRADHVLTLFGARFLRLHYRLLRRPDAARQAAHTLRPSAAG